MEGRFRVNSGKSVQHLVTPPGLAAHYTTVKVTLKSFAFFNGAANVFRVKTDCLQTGRLFYRLLEQP